jgi:Rod binding domain-containing protein
MNIQIRPGNIIQMNGQSSSLKKEKIAEAFEEIYARQMVKAMTKGLYKSNDNGIMGAGSDIYRMQIINTLSQELAEQHKLGIADMIAHYFNQESDKQQDG